MYLSFEFAMTKNKYGLTTLNFSSEIKFAIDKCHEDAPHIIKRVIFLCNSLFFPLKIYIVLLKIKKSIVTKIKSLYSFDDTCVKVPKLATSCFYLMVTLFNTLPWLQ